VLSSKNKIIDTHLSSPAKIEIVAEETVDTERSLARRGGEDDLGQSTTTGNCDVRNEAYDINSNATVDLSDDTDDNHSTSIQFNFETKSPCAIQKNSTVSLLSDDDGSNETEEDCDIVSATVSPTKVISVQPRHHIEGCCKGNVILETVETYENEHFEWTESCSAINDVLPPSFSGSYLYVRVKSEEDIDIMYVPGVSIINSPRESRREPEIYLCAVKCAKANELNFFYARIKDVEDFFNGIINKNLIDSVCLNKSH
jgi:hypothetical protein